MNEFAALSPLSQLLGAFYGGLLTSLTPCIYPLIPITLSVFGANQDASRARSFILALSYVLGIAVTYTGLGMVSATTGVLFGSLLSKPIFVFVITSFLLLLALFTLDALKFGALSRLQNAASRVGGKGPRGAFLMGTASGFVAAPCAGPLLVVILGVAAAQQNAAWGAALLFSYALGMGMIFLLLGLFPGFLRKLPRSGEWLHGVKFLMAVLVLMVALFLTQSYHGPLLGTRLASQQAILVACLIAAALAAIESYRRQRVGLRIGASLLMSCAAFYLILPPVSAHPTANHGAKSELQWHPTLEATLADAQAKNRLVMADLYADWCAACKELEAKTFSDPAVSAVLSTLSLARIDFTDEDEASDAVAEKYKVVGLPCLLFLRPNGEEIPQSRITGFLPPAEFLAHLERVLSE